MSSRILMAEEAGGLVHLAQEDAKSILQILLSQQEFCERFIATKPEVSVPSYEELFDALITALEGGSNYWYYMPIRTNHIREMAIKEAAKTGNKLKQGLAPSELICFLLGKDHKFLIVDDNDRQEELGWLSLEGLRRGAKIYIEQRGAFDSAMDAEEADCFLQYAVMGELVYG